MEKQQNHHHHHNPDNKKNHHHLHLHHRHNNQQTWGTWEELLLGYAVNRHGSKDWDAVAMEIQNRTNLPHLLTTARNCEQKFLDLKRRFTDQCNEAVPEPPKNGAPAGDVVDHVPWLDELRKLRVAELRQEVQRYDVSILSLQLKVKRLEKEREQDLKENDAERDEKPDLEDSGKPENDEKSGEEEEETEPAKSEPRRRVDDDGNDNSNDNNNKNNNNNNELPAGDESDRENQSVNESNSTGSRSVGGKTGEEDVKPEPHRVHPGPKEPDPSEERKVEDSSELRDSVAHSEGGGTRESSEVQSSASLTRKRKTRQRKKVSGGGNKGEGETPENEEVAVKSEPLVRLLELIKGHENSSSFERRLESQRKTEKYKSIVRHHVDLEDIQTRLRTRSYSSDIPAFFRDLLLLFTNAATFFHDDSVESRTAHQLHRLVSDEIKNHVLTRQPDPLLPHSTDQSLPPPPSQAKPDSSLLSKHKASAPILVCRKRTSISVKPSPAAATFGQKGSDQLSSEKKPALDSKPSQIPSSDDSDDEPPPPPPPPKGKEKPVTGTRSMRRSNKSLGGGVANQNRKLQSSGSTLKASSPKLDHKSKAAAEASVSDKKKNAAADFLKRIKRNSPADAAKSSGGGGGGRAGGGKEQKKVMSGGKNEKGRERVLRHSGGSGDKKSENNENSNQSKRSVGRPPKRNAETNASASAKRGRESSSGKDKRPKKRTRR